MRMVIGLLGRELYIFSWYYSINMKILRYFLEKYIFIMLVIYIELSMLSCRLTRDALDER